MEVNVNLKLLVSGMTREEQTDCLAETYEAMNDSAKVAFREEVLADYGDNEIVKEMRERDLQYRVLPSYLTCQLIAELRRRGCKVKVALNENGEYDY